MRVIFIYLILKLYNFIKKKFLESKKLIFLVILIVRKQKITIIKYCLKRKSIKLKVVNHIVLF
jgi:hypothetical protein